MSQFPGIRGVSVCAADEIKKALRLKKAFSECSTRCSEQDCRETRCKERRKESFNVTRSIRPHPSRILRHGYRGDCRNNGNPTRFSRLETP